MSSPQPVEDVEIVGDDRQRLAVLAEEAQSLRVAALYGSVFDGILHGSLPKQGSLIPPSLARLKRERS